MFFPTSGRPKKLPPPPPPDLVISAMTYTKLNIILCVAVRDATFPSKNHCAYFTQKVCDAGLIDLQWTSEMERARKCWLLTFNLFQWVLSARRGDARVRPKNKVIFLFHFFVGYHGYPNSLACWESELILNHISAVLEVGRDETECIPFLFEKPQNHPSAF
jgi:hypothetical protein